jgi:hypothetical protein
MWFLDEVVSGVLLRTFAPCLGAAVSLLLLGRVIELGYYVASDPQREYRRADGSAARRSATVVAANWGRASSAEQAELQPAVLDDAA